MYPMPVKTDDAAATRLKKAMTGCAIVCFTCESEHAVSLATVLSGPPVVQ